MNPSTPIYSICMCNYNMADTLERALKSVLGQIDERFEVVLVDDGSSDKSVEVAQKLTKHHPNLRVISLARDPERKLGFTRNLSIREARGEYVILHIDCDDVYENHLSAWVECYHQIQSAAGKNIMVAGQHIHMAPRDFLLSFGPYINIYRGEDREMYNRLASLEALWFLDHVDFATRLPKNFRQRLARAVFNTFDHMVNDFRGGTGFLKYYSFELQKLRSRSTKLILLRLLLLPIAFVASKWKEPILSQGRIDNHDAFNEYRAGHRGTLAELLMRFNKSPDVSTIQKRSQHIFF